MLQQPEPDDYVIATGWTHSIEELCELAFSCGGRAWNDFVERDATLVRPADIQTLVGDASKAKRVLGWEPATSFEQLISMMVKADMDSLGAIDAPGWEIRRGRIHARS